jgi:hypothetical protein
MCGFGKLTGDRGSEFVMQAQIGPEKIGDSRIAEARRITGRDNAIGVKTAQRGIKHE